MSTTLNPSITSWTRLEPRCREADMRTTLSARVFDPLWLLARQWQVGEFQGEDVGTPVLARVRAKVMNGVRTRIQEELGLDEREVQSLLAFARSQLDLSLRRHLE